MIEAKPTAYAGVNFRSRLEASWAAMWDQLGWKWEYEPFDMRGWTPDFLLMGAVPILVEVKPLASIDLDGPIPAMAAKALEGCAEYDVMVVGVSPNVIVNMQSAPSAIGWMWCREWEMTGGANVAEDGDIWHDQGSFKMRRSGLYDGDHHCSHMDGAEIARRWATARNETQWNRVAAKAGREDWAALKAKWKAAVK